MLFLSVSKRLFVKSVLLFSMIFGVCSTPSYAIKKRTRRTKRAKKVQKENPIMTVFDKVRKVVDSKNIKEFNFKETCKKLEEGLNWKRSLPQRTSEICLETLSLLKNLVQNYDALNNNENINAFNSLRVKVGEKASDERTLARGIALIEPLPVLERVQLQKDEGQLRLGDIEEEKRLKEEAERLRRVEEERLRRVEEERLRREEEKAELKRLEEEARLRREAKEKEELEAEEKEELEEELEEEEEGEEEEEEAKEKEELEVEEGKELLEEEEGEKFIVYHGGEEETEEEEEGVEFIVYSGEEEELLGEEEERKEQKEVDKEAERLRRAEEEARLRREKEEKERKEQKEAERLRRAEEEARLRREKEAKERKEQKEAERLRRAEEEARLRREKEEKERKEQKEAERLRREKEEKEREEQKEAERLRREKEEKERKEQEEADEEAERLRREKEAKERKEQEEADEEAEKRLINESEAIKEGLKGVLPKIMEQRESLRLEKVSEMKQDINTIDKWNVFFKHSLRRLNKKLREAEKTETKNEISEMIKEVESKLEEINKIKNSLESEIGTLEKTKRLLKKIGDFVDTSGNEDLLLRNVADVQFLEKHLSELYEHEKIFVSGILKKLLLFLNAKKDETDLPKSLRKGTLSDAYDSLLTEIYNKKEIYFADAKGLQKVAEEIYKKFVV
jgi:hypothetical protein